jgi:hypothetical protein
LSRAFACKAFRICKYRDDADEGRKVLLMGAQDKPMMIATGTRASQNKDVRGLGMFKGLGARKKRRIGQDDLM